MDFEQDYIMRMIQDVVRFLMQLITGRQQFQYDFANFTGNMTGNDNFARLIALADAGRINSAENMMYEDLAPEDKEYLMLGLAFYSHINEYSDDFLTAADYSRAEIQEGIRSLLNEYGITGLDAIYESLD